MNIHKKKIIIASIGFLLSSIIIFQASVGFSVQYKNVNNPIGWQNSLNPTTPQSILSIPQGNIGQKLIINILVDPYSKSNNCSFYLAILDNNNLINYKTKFNNIFEENISKLNSIFLKKLTYKSYNESNDFTFTIPFTKDGSYTILFIMSSNDLKLNKSIQFYSRLNIKGQDRLALILSIILFLLSLILLLTNFLKKSTNLKSNSKLIANFDNISFSENFNFDIKKTHKPDKNLESLKQFFAKMKIFLEYEFDILTSSFFFIVFLVFLVLIIGDRYFESYQMWLPSGVNIFGSLGTTLDINGLLKLAIVLSGINLVITLISFSEMEEEVIKTQITLPYSRNFYMGMKFLDYFIPDLILSLFYIGTTFILIPLRNSTISILPMTSLIIIFTLIIIFSLLFSSLSFFISMTLLNSRNAFLFNLVVIICTILYSIDLNKNLRLYSQINAQLPSQDNYWTHFTLLSLNRVFEYFIKRKILMEMNIKMKNWNLFIYYTHDTIYDSLLVISFFCIVICLSIIVTGYIFNKRNL